MGERRRSPLSWGPVVGGLLPCRQGEGEGRRLAVEVEAWRSKAVR